VTENKVRFKTSISRALGSATTTTNPRRRWYPTQRARTLPARRTCYRARITKSLFSGAKTLPTCSAGL
jgi:hypothetical protein